MAMPQDASYARLSGQVSETWRRTLASEDREWLMGLLSGRFADRGKLAAVAAIALLGGRRGRLLLWRLTMGSILFFYKYLTIVEVIIGFLVLAQVASKVMPVFTYNTQGGRRSATLNFAASPSNDGDRTGPNRAQRQNEKIQNHLQQLARAAATADSVNSRAANVAPSLHYHCERVTVEYPERNGTTLAVISSSNRNSPAGSALTVAGQAKSNPGCTDLSTTVRAQHRKGHDQHKEEPRKSLQEVKKSIVIHFQLPVYVCDLTFWNHIQIKVPSSSRSPPSTTVAGKYHSNIKDHASTSSDIVGRTAAPVYQIEMRMWMEMNRNLVAGRTHNYRNSCKNCSTGSHSVGKRRFECTYLGGNLDGHLDVRKNTFHAGRKLTILGSNDGLNFKFETALEQTLAGPGGNSPAFQQRATFTLLSQTSRPSGKSANQEQQSSKVEKGGISDKRQGMYGSGLLAVFRRNITAQSTLPTTSKCSVEALYTLEDRRIITKDYSGKSQ